MPYVQAGELDIYYELHGHASAETLVLLNGALDTIDSDWSKHLPAFAARGRVLAYDHRGHGRTSASPTPFSGYDLLVGDLLALLGALEITRAHFCGFSDGAITLLYFALRHPGRVRSLILAGAQYTNDQRSLALLSKMTPERIPVRLPEWATRLAVLHDTHHEPGYWQQLMGQMQPLWLVQPDLMLDQLAEIEVPTLLIAGERDGFGHIDQQVAMRRAIPHAELCILPVAGHDVLNDQPEMFRLAALDFLRRVELL
ncbi:MAG: alpha/beta hydrolase [Roseiflexaceae bacterium]